MMSTDKFIGEVAQAMVRHLAGLPHPHDRTALDRLAELVLKDATVEVRNAILASPLDHLNELSNILRPRVYQAPFRQEAGIALGHQARYPADTKTRVFLSYHRDSASDLVRHLAERLGKQTGIGVFFDQNTLSAGCFPPKIEVAIRRCHAFVMILAEGTPERLRDSADWVRRETELALQIGKPIIPISVRGCIPSDPLPLTLQPLKDFNRIDFRPDSREGFNAGFATLIQWIRGLDKRD